MKILGIETSCDETAAAVVEDGTRILSNVVVSQIDIFAEYGGVIPEVAARSHLEAMMPVVRKALSDAGCDWDDIDAIAVTHAPGLLGSLLVGTLTARTLAILHGKPLFAVHHLKSHVYANWLSGKSEKLSFVRGLESEKSHTLVRRESRPAGEPLGDVRNIDFSDSNQTDTLTKESFSDLPIFPLLALVVSGGHTQILRMRGHNQFEIVGTTRDDAVGECFDKVAKILGLPYPGGPAIAKAAEGGDENRYKFPHPKVEGLDFSFSGLKTAVLRAVQNEAGVPVSHPSHKLRDLLTEEQVRDFAASFQRTAVEILLEKLKMALEKYPETRAVVFAGGVSANKKLREEAEKVLCRERLGAQMSDFSVLFPGPSLSGDNGAMVAAAAYYEILSGVEPADPYTLNIYPRISIEK